MATVKCPVCGLEGEEGLFCENCGPSMGRLSAPSAEPAAAEPSAVAPMVNDAGGACGGLLKAELRPLPPLPPLAGFPDLPPLQFPPVGSFGGEAVRAAHAVPSAPPPVVIPDGMPFGAQVTFAQPMWKGVASPVKIAFKAARDIYADVEVSVLNGDESLCCRRHGCRPFQDEIRFSFNIRPRMPGKPIELTVRFECRRDGSPEPDVFEALFPVCVYEEQAHHINIDASTNVSGNGASVIKYKNNVGDGICIKDRRFEPTQNVTMPLEVSLAAAPRRLTLERDGEMIHLWALAADETIVCGRNDDCDYVLRVFDRATGAAADDKSAVISRRHFRFVLVGGRTLRVVDGVDSPSACGTFIGEMDVGRDGVVLTDGKYGIDLGTRFTPHGVLSLDVDVVRNGDDGSLAGFSMTRDDGLAERVVAIANRTVPFAGGAFAWDGRRFLFSGRRIIPGVSVEVAGESYEVRAFHQRKK